MDEHDTHLAARIRSGLGRLDIPAWRPEHAMARGRRRRRTARVGIAVGAILLSASIATPLAFLSGLHGAKLQDHPPASSRTAPPAHCPTVIPSPQPWNGIDCEAAAAQAWRVAAFVESAISAEIDQRPEGVAEGYSVPAWFVTLTGARYSAAFDDSGCSSAGTLERYTVVVSAASGRPLAFDRPPDGCGVEKSPRLIAPPYAGRTYVDPAGWHLVVPYGWTTTPIDVVRNGITLHGVQITNPPEGVDVPPPIKAPGSPAQSTVYCTSCIGVVIATDSDPSVQREPFLVPPIRLEDFLKGSALPQQPSLEVAWVHGPMEDIGVAVKLGAYVIPDDLMLLRSMVASFELLPTI